jgi:predicted flap endonuclease-1-like 5' DNA nuclease
MRRTCANGHTFEKSSDCPTCPTCERITAAQSSLPKIGAPATRALVGAGIHTLRDVAKWNEQDLLALHGVGPRAIRILQDHLSAEGLAFAQK